MDQLHQPKTQSSRHDVFSGYSESAPSIDPGTFSGVADRLEQLCHHLAELRENTLDIEQHITGSRPPSEMTPGGPAGVPNGFVGRMDAFLNILTDHQATIAHSIARISAVVR